MKKTIITLLVSAVAAFSVPAFATEHMHEGSGKAMSEEYAKECDMLLKNCAMEVDSINERINKIKKAISEKGTDVYTLDELKLLNKKLKEANDTMRELTKPGH